MSERDTKIKELNKANHNVDNERKTLDTEYSFSEEYREPIEETKVNNNTKNNQTTKFSLNMNKKSNNDNTATNDEAAASVQVLNFECLKRNDFNDEFVQNYEDFSPSWRKECDRLNLRKKNY